jgi:hypothetical protein
MFVVKNLDIFILYSDIHNIQTRYRSDLHHATYKLAEFQKGMFYSGIRIFNKLPQNIKNLSSDASKFGYALNQFLHIGSFYSLREYFDWVLINDIY